MIERKSSIFFKWNMGPNQRSPETEPVTGLRCLRCFSTLRLGSVFQIIHRERWVIQTETLVQWAGWVSDQCLCSAARGQSRAPSEEIQHFSGGWSSPRSCCNYVALERYRGNRLPASFTPARTCMYQWNITGSLYTAVGFNGELKLRPQVFLL